MNNFRAIEWEYMGRCHIAHIYLNKTVGNYFEIKVKIMWNKYKEIINSVGLSKQVY